jgi:hypothetical protein
MRTDCWADWLIRGRQRGFDERQVRALGLLALEARRRVGEFGRVIALDIPPMHSPSVPGRASASV